MQKKLEAELISIAHRILKLKNKSELDQLYLETGKLYEKLTVLKFLETHFADAKPTIGYAEVSDKLAVVFDEPQVAEEQAEPVDEAPEDEISEQKTEEVSTEEKETPKEPEVEETPKTEPEPEVEEPKVEEVEIEEPKASEENTETDSPEIEGGVDTEIPEEQQVHSMEEEAEAVDVEHEIQETEEEVSEKNKEEFKPSFELSFERKEEEDKKAPKQISFEDLLGGHNYSDDIFERAGAKKEEVVATEPEQPVVSEQKEAEPVKEEIKEAPKPEVPQYQSASIDKSEYEKPAASFNGKTISFGLNDKIGFEKHLFGGSSEDMNRVISQLNTFNSFQEAQDFIEDMVKPDYNDWANKDDYAQRFMEIVEKKFN